MSQKISIISLGWLGLAVYENFQNVFQCFGSYHNTPKDLEHEFYFDVNEFKALPSQIENSDIVFFNVPPSKIIDLNSLRALFECLKDKRVVLISSTSVYEQNELVDESSLILKNSARAIKQVEIEEILIDKVQDSLILRCAGLYSDDRHPGYFLSGKENIAGPSHSVNLVSKKDILTVLEKVMISSKYKIINLVNTHHPTKKEYYNTFCKNNNLAKVKFEDDSSVSKIVSTRYSEFIIDSKLP